MLCQELRSPKYGAYFVYFTNRIDRTSIEKLAQADDHESVREVKVKSEKQELNSNRHGIFDIGVLC